MEQEALNRLNELTHTEVSALTDEQIGFIRARRDYLSEAEKEFYTKNGILGDRKPEVTEETNIVTEVTPELSSETDEEPKTKGKAKK